MPIVEKAGRQSHITWAAAFLALACLFVSSGCRDSSYTSQPLDEDSLPATTDDAFRSQPRVVIGPMDRSSSPGDPAWAADAIFYQIFPERFRNGDPSNDPTNASLEFPEVVPESWSISPWIGDWYARADWELAMGDDFYDDGVFHRRYGGDLEGVIDKLDYLEQLGINAISLNPVFYARSSHKYDGISLHHVDPHFGPDPAGDYQLMASETSDPTSWHWTAADQLFLDLIHKAHERRMRLIIDGVFNHTGRDFFAFADLRLRQADSPYRDWYVIESFDDPETPGDEFRYQGWSGVDTLPEFANDPSGDDLHPGPKAYIFEITRRWMDPDGNGDPSDGVDGWRLDVASEVPLRFWQQWTALAEQLNPELYTVAENWHAAQGFLSQGGFSATTNYHGFAFPVKGFLIDGVLTPSDAVRQLNERRQAYDKPVQYVLQNLIDSHDTDRLGSMVVNAGDESYLQPDRFDYDVGERVSPRHWPEYDIRKPSEAERHIQRLVALFQMSYLGAPMIYYGTEAGMWGGDDPCDRMPMVWPELQYEPQIHDPLDRPREADTVEFDQSLFDYYREAIRFRNKLSPLRRGEIEFVHTDDEAKFLAFKRWEGDHILFVALNRGNSDYRWVLALPEGTRLTQIFTASGRPQQHNVAQQNDETIVTVPALDGAILRLRTR